MQLNVEKLLEDFVSVANLSGFSVDRDCIVYEVLPSPHTPNSLPKNKQAVYVFSISEPVDKVLKVGKVGPNSNARFLSQHYNPRSSNSNLSSSLIKHPETCSFLGIDADLNSANVGAWIKENVDRENFYIDAKHGKYLLGLLEVFLQCRLNPVFEG